MPGPALVPPVVGWDATAAPAKRAGTVLMARHSHSSGSIFEQQIGYARAVVDGNWIFVSGTTGFDYQSHEISSDVVAQARQCLANIRSAMTAVGFSLDDVVRVHYILPDRADFEPCWPTLRDAFGSIKPAATMIVAGLADPRMKIEIEVTGRKRTA